MTVYFQHVGDQNSARDFPRTIGMTSPKLFNQTDLGAYSSLIPSKFCDFQIWGIPEKAERVFEKLAPGDWFLLMGTTGGGGGIEYIGEVLHSISGRQPQLSKQLWTEEKFPWIFLLRGQIKHIPWPQFLQIIGYAPNFDPRGRIYGIANWRLFMKGFYADRDLIEALMAT